MDTHLTYNDASQNSWFLVLISSIACILGASVVFIDTVWPSSTSSSSRFSSSSVLERPSVIASSMSLAAGVMLFSSLYTLLPASRTRLGSDHLTFFYYFVGVGTTVVINRCIHWCAPKAIHAYNEGPHGGDSDGATGTTDYMCHHHHHPHTKSCSSSSSQSTLLPVTSTTAHDDNHQPLQQQQQQQQQPLIKFAPGEGTRLASWDSVEYGSTDRPYFDHQDEVDVDVDDVETANNYFRIGIQTAVAICIHKFPEGLIMFISGQASRRLGLSVCAAMTIHNFIEGFMIALPLYFATKSRASAFGYAALLGGMSQPVGAALGLVAFHQVNQSQQDILFGITFGVVSGMMSFIAIQSMLPQAIRADTRQQYASVFFFIGIFLVGLASLLKSV